MKGDRIKVISIEWVSIVFAGPWERIVNYTLRIVSQKDLTPTTLFAARQCAMRNV